MIVLGLDSATTTGWAVVEGGNHRPRLHGYGAVRATSWQVIADVIEHARTLGAELAAIETPYVDKNPDTAIKLGIICGRWVQELERAGIPWGAFKAGDWQYKVLVGLISTSSKREQRKRAARIWCSSTYSVVVGEDPADAICLATWRAKQEHFEERSRAAAR